MAAYLAAHIFEICCAQIGCPQRAMHCLKRLACVISGYPFCFNVIKEVLNKVHLWEIPGPLLIHLKNDIRFASITFSNVGQMTYICLF